MKSPFLWCILRILVGFVFAYAGFSKLLEPSANFEAALLKYGVFSPLWIPWIARILPWLEWLLGSLLTLGYAPRVTAAGISFLALCFLVTLASSNLLLESGSTDCGCFGRSGLQLTLRQVFLVDLLSLAVSLRIIFLDEFPFTLHSFLLKRTGGEDDK